MAHIQTVDDATGAPVGSINVRISDGDQSSDAAKFDYETKPVSGNQTWPIPDWPAKRYTLHANVEIVNGGRNELWNPLYESASKPSDPDANGNFGNVEIRLVKKRPIGQEAGQLHVRGRDFYSDNDQPWQFRGWSAHYLLNCLIGGYACDPIDAVLDQVIDYGYNTIVTVGMHASPWKVANGWALTPLTQPAYFTWLALLFDKAADRKLRIAHAPLADMQHYTGDKQAFWRESCDVMRGRWNILPRKGNEDFSNGWHPNDYQFHADMGGLLLSQGSRGEGTKPKFNPYFPYLDWVEYEVVRKAPKMFLDLPLRQMQDGDFAGPATNRPTVNIEPMFFADTNPDHVGDARSTDPRVALEMGVMMAESAGGAFGCSLGLECRVLPAGSISDQCAKEFIRGLKAGFVRPFAALDFHGDH